MNNNKFSLFKNIDENPDDIIEHDLYNDKNFLINCKQVQEILEQCEIDYKINNLELYQRAFIHKSYIEKEECVKIIENKINALELQKKSYERLEFLGDSILGAIVVSYLYERFFDQNEGTMTKYKAKLVSKHALAEFSRILGFSKYFVISKQIEESNGRENINILEDTFEAFLGALYLDFNEQFEQQQSTKTGFQVCEEFMLYILENEVDMEKLVVQDTNFKDKLLKYYHHNFQQTPQYKKLELNNYNNKEITIAVLDIDGNIFSTATSNTKKKAEQLASKNALLKLGELDLTLLDEDN